MEDEEYYNDQNSEYETETESESNKSEEEGDESKSEDEDNQSETVEEDNQSETGEEDNQSETGEEDNQSETGEEDNQSETGGEEDNQSETGEEDNQSDENGNNHIDNTTNEDFLASNVWKQSSNFIPNVQQCGYGLSTFNFGPLDFYSTPLTILQHIIQDDLIKDIIDQTNLYASQIKKAKPSTLKTWHEVTIPELWSFLGLQLLMGVVKKPSYKDYWTKNAILFTPVFSQTMARDRFLSILRAFHFIDNESKGATNHRLNKLGNLLPTVLTRFKELLEPGEFLCVDESLLLFKGRLSFLQYIPTKRSRFGVKFYVLVDCETKFVIDVLPYTGKSTRISAELVDKLGYGGATVIKLTEPFLHEHRKVVVDNYFTSPLLADYLLKKQTYILGTCKPNRKQMPKMTAKLKKGEVEIYHTENKMVERWCDRRNVHILSTFLTHEMIEVQSKFCIKASSKSQQKQLKMKPASVILYNQKMGGVDDVDRQIEPYTTERKTTKWYRKVAFHLIDLCIYNAFIIYKQIRGGIDLEYKPFLLELIAEMLTKYNLPKTQKGRPVQLPVVDEERIKGLHVPSPQFTHSGNASRVECRFCLLNGKRRLTQYICKKCNERLCVTVPDAKQKMITNSKMRPVTCFEKYHTVNTLPRKKNKH